MSASSAASSGAVRAAPLGGRDARRRALVAWSFALPFVVLLVVFMAGPILVSFATSFTDMRVTDIRDPLGVELVGFQNYVTVLGDASFQKAAFNTAIYVLVGVPLTMGVALLVAIALNQGIVRLRSFFRVGYYLPYVTSIAAVAVVWRLLLARDTGLLNAVLAVVGIDGPGWLTDQRLALGSLIVMASWRGTGFLMVIFLAGLQSIPNEILEAAEVDGATRWRRFRTITLPMLRPTLLLAAVISLIGWLQFFEEPFVMTQGGPLDATRSIAFDIYDEFSFGNYGTTSAMSYLLFLAIALLTFAQFRIFRPAT